MARGKASTYFAALLLGMAAGASGQGTCPSTFKGCIEKLSVPFKDAGTTIGADNVIENYNSPTCRIPNQEYDGGEAVYEVRLNPGNEVSFYLVGQNGADLVLALVMFSGKDRKCISSSADFIGPGAEEIPAAKYPPGIYYLYIDSATGAPGGPYELTVSGVNPTPKLELKVDAPSDVFAGTLVTYDVVITNRGDLAASNVEVVHTLPKGMALESGPGCPGGRVTFPIDRLEIGATATRKVVARFCPNVRGPLTVTAEAKADQGSPADPAQANIRVNGKSVLELQITSSGDPVVAGKPLTYTFTIHNNGPSDATGVTLVDTLDSQETFSRASADWQCQKEAITATVSCGPLAIPVNRTVTRSITVNTRSSALQTLVNKATVNAAEAVSVSDFEDTQVERETDLTIDLDQDPTGEIALGNPFAYVITVLNNGPSDSSGSTVKVILRDSKGNAVPREIGIPSLSSGGHKTVEIPVKTTADQAPEQLDITASVTPSANEEDPGPGNSDTLKTTLKIQADLSIESAADLTEVCVGGVLVYTVTVVNGGPSNYRGGEIFATLSKGLSFVSSPDGCWIADNSPQKVTCPVPPLAVKEGEHRARIVALVDHTEEKVFNEVSAKGFDEPPMVSSERTTVLPHLVVSLSADSSVATGKDLEYTVTVKNRGPSDAEDVEVKLELPSGVGASLQWKEILKGKSESKTHLATAPTASGSLTARAFLVNPAHCGNTAEVTTAVTDGNEVALAVTLAADAQAVAVGDTLTYTIQVDNLGLGASPTVTITDELPKDSVFDPTKSSSDCAPAAGKVECANLTLPLTVTIAVQVQPGAQTPLTNMVFLGPAPAPIASIDTPVLPGRLLLPFFEVGESSKEVTTLVAVRNPPNSTNKPVGVKYDFLIDPVNLLPHAMNTRNLRDEVGFAGTTGYAAISSDPPDASLGGDFVRVDPTPGTASGGLLVPATEMCREWSVRFLNGGPLKTSTDFLFFAPGNSVCPPDSACPPVATGKVFTEKGQYLQDLAITNTGEAFRIGTQDLGLLANFGSIEWTFREGLVGHVAAVHREKGKDEVAVPGHCRTDAVTPALILPFFQADPGTTLLAFRNENDGFVEAKVSIFSSDGTQPESPVSFNLAGHGTQTLRLGGDSGVREGYAQVDLVSPTGADISGDFLLLDSRARAGSALVRRSQLCRCWDVRFLNDSQILFYVEGTGTATGQIFEEDGTPLPPPVTTPLDRRSFLLSAPPGQGAIEWDLGKDANGRDVLGYVAALFTGQGTEGDYSVLVPGLCRPCPPEPLPGVVGQADVP